jgi:hypothetical protein
MLSDTGNIYLLEINISGRGYRRMDSSLKMIEIRMERAAGEWEVPEPNYGAVARISAKYRHKLPFLVNKEKMSLQGQTLVM